MNGRELFEIYAQEKAEGTQRGQYWEWLDGAERDLWNRVAARLVVGPDLDQPYVVDRARYVAPSRVVPA